jgi:hypothetical protein
MAAKKIEVIYDLPGEQQGRSGPAIKNLHPYDSVERRFRHTDPTPGDGRAIVAQVLCLPEPPAGELLFDLSFYSGGCGVIDRLAIAAPADPVLWSSVVKSLGVQTLEEARGGEFYAEDLIWLLTGKEEQVALPPAAVRFINEERREFQTECLPTSRILVGKGSDVNAWKLLWGDDTRLNYLGYRQG